MEAAEVTPFLTESTTDFLIDCQFQGAQVILLGCHELDLKNGQKLQIFAYELTNKHQEESILPVCLHCRVNELPSRHDPDKCSFSELLRERWRHQANAPRKQQLTYLSSPYSGWGYTQHS